MNQKRAVVFIFLALLMFSFVAGVVSAQGEGDAFREQQVRFAEEFSGSSENSISKKIFDPVKSLFTDWEQGNLSRNIAKYLFWFLITLLVYGVTKYMPIIKALHEFPRFLIALAVGFLAIAYMTPSDVYTALAGYTALGFALSALLPLIILLFFSVEIGREGGISGRLVVKITWFIYIVFILWKLIDGIFGITSEQVLINSWEGWAYVGVIVFSLLWILFIEKKFLKMLFKEESSAILDENLHDVANVLVAEISQREERSQRLQGAAKTTYDRHTDRLRARLAEVNRKLGR